MPAAWAQRVLRRARSPAMRRPSSCCAARRSATRRCSSSPVRPPGSSGRTCGRAACRAGRPQIEVHARTPATSSASRRRSSARGATRRPRCPQISITRGAGLSHEVRQQLTRSAPGDPRAGGAHSRRDAGGGVDPARAPEEARGERAPGSHERLHRPARQAPGSATTRWSASGLDPEIERFPRHIAAEASPIFQFNRAIIDATADLVCAYKPQFAHYAAYEAEDQLERTIEYIHRTYPDVPVILDAKRGDVGNTAERYAIEAFERYGADAVTVNPYLGTRLARAVPALRGPRRDRPVPHLQSRRRRSAGPAGRRPQALPGGGASSPRERWNTRGNCALVVGATYPRELAEVRALVGDMPLLVPGRRRPGRRCGAGGAAAGRRRAGTGLIVSSSRAILYASAGADFAQRRARRRPQTLRGEINAARARPPA